MLVHAVILKYLEQINEIRAERKIVPLEVKMEAVAKVRTEFRNFCMIICSSELDVIGRYL